MLLRQIEHQAERFAMPATPWQLVDAEGGEPPFCRKDEKLIRGLRMQCEAVPIAFLKFEIILVLDMAFNGANPAFH